MIQEYLGGCQFFAPSWILVGIEYIVWVKKPYRSTKDSCSWCTTQGRATDSSAELHSNRMQKSFKWSRERITNWNTESKKNCGIWIYRCFACGSKKYLLESTNNHYTILYPNLKRSMHLWDEFITILAYSYVRTLWEIHSGMLKCVHWILDPTWPKTDIGKKMVRLALSSIPFLYACFLDAALT